MGHVDLHGLWHEAAFRLVETYDVTLETGWRIDLADQPYGEVFRLTSGRCRVELGGEVEHLEPGDVGVLLPGPDRVTADVGKEPLRFHGFGFRVQLFGSVELSGLLRLPLRLAAPDDEVTDALEEAVHWGRQDGAVAALQARARAELAVAALTRRHGDVAAPTGSVRREVADAIALMEADPGGELDLARVAAEVHLSVKHFSRVFRSVTGVPPMTYLQALRLSRARAALLAEDRPVAAVASDLGFCDAAHFTRSFRQHYGCTPTELRARARALTGGPDRPEGAPLAQDRSAPGVRAWREDPAARSTP